MDKLTAWLYADVFELLESEAGVVGSPSDVANMFTAANAAGINLIRFFPYGVWSTFKLQTAPGDSI